MSAPRLLCSLAELDANGKVLSSQLPSYVDDVIEYTKLDKFPSPGESGKIYVCTETDRTYRWTGTGYREISESLALGETTSTAYRGDRGKTAYEHSQNTHARYDATKVEESTNGKIKIDGTDTTVYTHPGSGTNPHGTTKEDVGLGNVGNFKAVSTISGQGLTDLEKANARSNIGAGTSSFSGSYNDLSDKPTIPTGGAANKSVDTVIPEGCTSQNVPTSAAVAAFVEERVDDVEEEISNIASTKTTTTSPITDSTEGNINAIKLVGSSHKSGNLINPTLNTTTTNGITCTKNGDGTYTLNGTSTARADFILLASTTPMSLNGTYRAILTNGAISGVTFRIGSASVTNESNVTYSNATTIGNCFIMVSSGTTLNNIVVKPMLTTDTSATYNDYEPYGIIQPSGDVVSHDADNTKSSTVHTDRPLLSIGNIKNELIINADGSGKFVERVKEVDLGTLTYTYANGVFYSAPSGMKYGTKKILSDMYDVVNSDFAWGSIPSYPNNSVITGNSTNQNIYIKNTSYTEASAFKSAMNGIKLIYELATPTTTDLSVSEVADMLSLKTYSGQTYIDTDGAEFEVSYFVDSNIAKAISDNKGYITEVAERLDSMTDTQYTFAEGTTNGTIKVTSSDGSSSEVPVHGLGSVAYRNNEVSNVYTIGPLDGKTTWVPNDKLVTVNTVAYWDGSFASTNHLSNLKYTYKGAIGDAAIKGVDTSITSGSTSANLPTSSAVASYVNNLLEGNGYVTDVSGKQDKLTAGEGIVIDNNTISINTGATSTSSTTLDNSAEGNINAIKLVGSSHKSGNLWSLNNSYSGIGNIVSKQNISLAQGTYTISFKSDIATSYATFAFLKADGTTSVGAVQVNRPSCVGTVTLTDKAEKVIIYNPTSCTVYDIQINEGTSALPYEPYGIIQPSGDVVSHSENIITNTISNKTSSGITLTNNDGKYILNGTASATLGDQFQIIVDGLDANKTYHLKGCPKNGSETTYRIRAIGGTVGVSDIGNGCELSGGTQYKLWIQVFQGVTVNNLVFEPFVCSSYSSSHTDRPLLSIGNIKNELIINADGSGKFVERVGKIVGSSSNANGNIGARSDGLLVFSVKDTSIKNNGNYICDYPMSTIEALYNTATITNACAIWSWGNQVAFCVAGITNLDQAKNWLNENRPTIIYELATPTTTDLSVSEVADMLSLKTYSGQTYIDTDGAEFEVSYFVDSNIAKAISDNKGYITEVAESVDNVKDWVESKGYITDISGKVDNTADGLSAVINKLGVGSSAPADMDYYVCQYANGGTTNTSYYRRPMLRLWDYIKSKIDAAGFKSSNATTSADGLMSSVDKTKLDRSIGATAYATCDTAAGTAEKLATVQDNSNWSLQIGSIVFVKFSNTNIASGVTLNVNNSGAKHIYYSAADQTATTTTSSSSYGVAGRVHGYVYDGTYWVLFYLGSDVNTTYTNQSLGQCFGTCTTAAATISKTVSMTNYISASFGIVAIRFTNAVPANATLNINNKGAKNIRYKNANITAGIINAGDLAVMMCNGSYYELLCKESASSGDSWSSVVQLVTGDTTVVFDNLDSTKGYDLYSETADGSLVSISSCAKATGTTSGTIKLTYTVKAIASSQSPVNFKLRILN